MLVQPEVTLLHCYCRNTIIPIRRSSVLLQEDQPFALLSTLGRTSLPRMHRPRDFNRHIGTIWLFNSTALCASSHPARSSLTQMNTSTNLSTKIVISILNYLCLTVIMKLAWPHHRAQKVDIQFDLSCLALRWGEFTWLNLTWPHNFHKWHQIFAVIMVSLIKSTRNWFTLITPSYIQ